MYPGVIVAPYAMTGGTDARFYTPVCENSIRFAPLEINEQQYQSIHGIDENISISALPPAVDFIRESCATWKDGKNKIHIRKQLQRRDHYE